MLKFSKALQPLLIPTHLCIDISMDFIVGIPRASNKVVTMVVLNILSKLPHLCSLSNTFTASLVSQDFMDYIFKLHGMLISIMLD